MPSAGSYTSKIGYLSVAKNVKVQLPGGVSNTFRPGLSDMCSDFKTTIPATTETTGGIITTFAGNGDSSITGDNGTAVNAGLGYPTSVIDDLNGNIFYVAVDELLTTTTIRRIDVNGVITNTGVAFTYVDSGGFDTRIKCFTIDKSTGIIYFCNETVIYQLNPLGTGASILYQVPLGVTGDDVYLFRMSHIAFDETTQTFLVSNIGNQRIYRVPLEIPIVFDELGFPIDYIPPVFANIGGIGAVESRPITVDSNGNVYTTLMIRSDITPSIRRYSWRVRKYSPSAVIAWTVEIGSDVKVSNTYNEMLLPGITIGPDGNVYVSSALTDTIIRIDKDNSSVSVFAGGGPLPTFSGDGGLAIRSNLRFPRGIAFDSNSNLFICDWANLRIRKVTPFVTTTIPGRTLYNPPWFAPVEYAEACKCKVVTRSAEFPQNIVYDGQQGS